MDDPQAKPSAPANDAAQPTAARPRKRVDVDAMTAEQYAEYVRSKIAAGLADADAGRTISHEEVGKLIDHMEREVAAGRAPSLTMGRRSRAT